MIYNLYYDKYLICLFDDLLHSIPSRKGVEKTGNMQFPCCVFESEKAGCWCQASQ